MSKRRTLKEIHRSPPAADELTSVWHREDGVKEAEDGAEAAGSDEPSDLSGTPADD